MHACMHACISMTCDRECSLTCAVHGLAVCAAPGELGDGHAHGAAAEEHVVAHRAADASHSRVDTRGLATPQLGIAKQHTGEALGFGAPQASVDERHR